MRARFLILSLVIPTLSHADTLLPLQNGNFEQGLEGWKLDGADESAKVTPEAALLGDKGLRVESPSGTKMSLLSAPVNVTPGKTYTVTFWAAGDGGADAPGTVDVKMIFKGAAGEELQPGMAKIRKWPGISVGASKFAAGPLLAAAAPEGATTLAVRVSTTGKTGVGPLKIDDFQVTELGDEAPPVVEPGQANPIPPSDPARLKALEEEITANPSRGKTPPKIVLKLDDIGAVRGGVHPKWLKVADFCKAKGVKVTFGIIASKISEDCPAFVKWAKEEHAAGRIEFWHHGWDHGERKDGDKRLMEFSGETLEYQQEHLAKANALVKEKLGFPLVSFGAPFNATDANTIKALANDPDIKVWMYGDPSNPAGKTVLERCYAVTIETPTFIPNYGAFLEGYAHNRGAEYFVMQGHPAQWNEERWDQFVKIVEFLIGQKAEFVFASDFAKK